VDGIPLDPSYTWTSARARGVTRGQIRADGVPIARGLYVSRSQDLDLAARCGAWGRVLPADAAFGLDTAATLYGVGGPTDRDVDVVLRPRRVLPQRSGIRVHARALLEDDVAVVNGLRVTSGAQTYLDMAATLFPADLLALGDALLRADIWTPSRCRAGLPAPTGCAGWPAPASGRRTSPEPPDRHPRARCGTGC
jgi:hypothetical protein